MKVVVPICFLVAATAWSQSATKPPAAPTPGGPSIQSITPAPAGQPAAAIKPDSVVASVQGKPVTAGEVQAFIEGFPPQVKQSYQANPREMLRQFLVFRYISMLGEKKGLDQQSPWKEQLAFMRTQILWQAQFQAVNLELNGVKEDYDKYYNEHKDKYIQAKVKAIYIPFSAAAEPAPPADPKAKKPMTEPQARARAEEVVKLAKSGTDFGELVKKYSEDPQSSQKGGELPPISKSDALPEPLKTAIFSLKKDEVSEPVKHTNGYYIFRGEGTTVQTLDQVRDQINQELKGERMKEWMAKTEKEADIKFENEAFFAKPPAGKPPAAKPAQ